MLQLLITLDCLRADHVGPDRGLTPRLDGLREEFTRFTQAFSQSQNTLSSLLTLLTSNYLFQHGVYSNFVRKDLPPHALPRRLAERGFETKALSGVSFVALLLGNQAGPADPWFVPPADRSLRARVLRRLRGDRRSAGATLADALRWLDSPARRRDAFLWVHLFDAHMLYSAPAPFLRRHAPRAGAGHTVADQAREKGWFFQSFPEFGWRVPLDHFPRRYAAAVAYLDESLGGFFGALKARGWWDDALVAVTADHGECLLGDHGVYCAHKKLFDTTTRVPLLVKFPGRRHAGEEVDALVEHVDVAPTFAGDAGFEEPLYMGTSLRRVAAGESPGHTVAFSEHVDNFMRAVRDRDRILVEVVPGAQNKWGMPLEEGSLFARDASPAPEGESAEGARLKAALDAVMASGGEAARAWERHEGEDAGVAEQLQRLGYL